MGVQRDVGDCACVCVAERRGEERRGRGEEEERRGESIGNVCNVCAGCVKEREREMNERVGNGRRGKGVKLRIGESRE